MTNEQEFRWGSYLPILETASTILDLHTCMEFGMGVISTPYIYQKFDTVVSVESDLKWFKLIRSQLSDRKGFSPIFCLTLGIKKTTQNVTNKILKQYAKEFCEYILEEFSHVKDVLLIDHQQILRSVVLVHCHNRFNCIIFHDSGPEYDKRYRYIKAMESVDRNDFFWLTCRNSINDYGTSALIRKTIVPDICMLIEKISIAATQRAVKYGMAGKVLVELN